MAPRSTKPRSDRPEATHRSKLYQAAIERRKDAQALLECSRFHGAIYLAGYVIECYLKYLICERNDLLYLEDWEERFERRSKRPAQIRGKRGHDLEWLLELSRLDQPLLADADLGRQFAIVNRWSVDMRYRPASVSRGHAERSINAVDLIRAWLQTHL